MRICAKMDLSKVLPKHVLLNPGEYVWKQTLDYEHVKFHCRSFLMLGTQSPPTLNENMYLILWNQISKVPCNVPQIHHYFFIFFFYDIIQFRVSLEFKSR
jgi:hypothetical protein